MSVIVKGMDIPSNCNYCPLFRWYPQNGNCWCVATNKRLMSGCYEVIDFIRPKWCPLEEFPEKDGEN